MSMNTVVLWEKICIFEVGFKDVTTVSMQKRYVEDLCSENEIGGKPVISAYFFPVKACKK